MTRAKGKASKKAQSQATALKVTTGLSWWYFIPVKKTGELTTRLRNGEEETLTDMLANVARNAATCLRIGSTHPAITFETVPASETGLIDLSAHRREADGTEKGVGANSY
jgi:hypothetical protein